MPDVPAPPFVVSSNTYFPMSKVDKKATLNIRTLNL